VHCIVNPAPAPCTRPMHLPLPLPLPLPRTCRLCVSHVSTLRSLCCVAEIDALMRAALRPVLVQVPCLAARVSPAACPWRLRSCPCVASPAVGVPSLGLSRATILSAETSAGLLCSALLCALPLRCEVNATSHCACAATGLGFGLGIAKNQ